MPRSLGENVSGVSEELQGNQGRGAKWRKRNLPLCFSTVFLPHCTNSLHTVTFNYLLSKLIKLDSRAFGGKTNSD